jgi:hypothetical protein
MVKHLLRSHVGDPLNLMRLIPPKEVGILGL